MCGRDVGLLRNGFCVFAVIITIAYHALLKLLVSYRPYFSFLFLRLSIRCRSCIFHSCVFHPFCLLLICPLLLFHSCIFSVPYITQSTLYPNKSNPLADFLIACNKVYRIKHNFMNTYPYILQTIMQSFWKIRLSVTQNLNCKQNSINV